jgi:predicted anti-sigma-YlaC factor YlaD
MMPLKKEHIESLLRLVRSVQEDCLDCDGCYDRIAEFAEIELSGREIPEALVNVRIHLHQCPCCTDEYNALIEGLEAIKRSCHKR